MEVEYPKRRQDFGAFFVCLTILLVFACNQVLFKPASTLVANGKQNDFLVSYSFPISVSLQGKNNTQVQVERISPKMTSSSSVIDLPNPYDYQIYCNAILESAKYHLENYPDINWAFFKLQNITLRHKQAMKYAQNMTSNAKEEIVFAYSGCTSKNWPLADISSGFLASIEALRAIVKGKYTFGTVCNETSPNEAMNQFVQSLMLQVEDFITDQIVTNLSDRPVSGDEIKIIPPCSPTEESLMSIDDILSLPSRVDEKLKAFTYDHKKEELMIKTDPMATELCLRKLM